MLVHLFQEVAGVGLHTPKADSSRSTSSVALSCSQCPVPNTSHVTRHTSLPADAVMALTVVERLAAAACCSRKPVEEPGAKVRCELWQRRVGGGGPFVVEHDAFVVAVEEQRWHGREAGGWGAVAQEEGQPHAQVDVAHTG